MASTPYSFVSEGGVSNTRTRLSEDNATLEQLASQYRSPALLDTPAREYHSGTKRERGEVKRHLSYFIGGVVKGKRDDANVQARTLLTLDIERPKEGETAPPPPEEVIDRLRQLGGCGWVYTSVSHTPDEPRYRVVLPLGDAIKGTVEAQQQALKASTLNAARKLGVEDWCAPESWVLSQAMYLPAKLKGGTFFQKYVPGKAWRTVRAADIPDRVQGQPADIPDERPDHVLLALKAAGLYLQPNPKHKGMHFIKCPFIEQHDAENDTQTVYYEAHFDGNPRPAVKCFDTAPDEDGKPHLTYTILVRWLRKQGHLDSAADATGVLDDYATFRQKADLGQLLDVLPAEREWAIEQFAPCGKVTVLAGPGGVSKTMLLLNVLVHAALNQPFACFKPQAQLRSLYVSYEDDTQELHKRVHALTQALIEQDDGALDALYDVRGTVRANLLMYAADEEAASWVLMLKPDRFGAAEATERVEWLVGFLKEYKIKLLALDPAVYTHQLEENSITDMAAYMQMLTRVAKQANCAIVVLHHMHKAAGWASIDEINQGSLRGASSFADNARSVGVCISMPIKDGPTYGLPTDPAITSQYMVFKHVKHNYSASVGVHVFERKGPLLIPRTDVKRLDATEMAEARDTAKADEIATRVRAWVPRVAVGLLDFSGPCTQNQIIHAVGVKSTVVKHVLDHMEAEDLIELEEGPNRSKLVSLTAEGRSYAKLVKKESKR